MSRASTEKPNAECLAALVILDSLVPESRFYGTLACRSTFKNWEHKGCRDLVGNVRRLPVYQVPGIGRAVRPSELKAFLDEIGRLKAYPA